MCLYICICISISLYIYIYHISSNYDILFRDVVLGYWGRFVITLYELRLLRPLSFLSTPIATQASAAVVHSYLPYFQEFFCITHILQFLKAMIAKAQVSWVSLSQIK